ncbi:MAG: group II intron reverse transcriptase/maturase, partial [Firmicutes bacterium]|nr:group II intron reverse transcriptase/maturase [Bacillota bacterium]
DRPWKRGFLGFSFTQERKPRVRLAAKARERFPGRIREITGRSNGRNMGHRISALNVCLRGWMGCFRMAETPSVFHGLGEWIRRRLRMCLLGQWKRPLTRRRNLVALGIPEDWARNISGSRKGYRRLALTPQLSKALGLAYWRNQGLLSLSDLYSSYR